MTNLTIPVTNYNIECKREYVLQILEYFQVPVYGIISVFV